MDNQIFETIKQVNDHGQEYRQARSFAKVLGYVDFSNFRNVIKHAQLACEKSLQDIDDHFSESTEMVAIGSGAQRAFASRDLSRYACYLIIQNADPSKEAVALGQTYFAIQTRKQEVSQQHLEDQKRVHLRDEVTRHNKRLFSTAKSAGVTDYANFYDYGYLGLYGMRKKDIITTKHLEAKDNILDHMDSEELAANLFRATQAEAKIKRENIKGQEQASRAHYDVGQTIRQTIKELGGTMPEDIPAVADIKDARKRLKELEHHLEGGRVMIAHVPAYPLPSDIETLQTIITILQQHSGELNVKLGEQYYPISQEGLVLLEKLLS